MEKEQEEEEEEEEKKKKNGIVREMHILQRK
jgi:hypothetical protein